MQIEVHEAVEENSSTRGERSAVKRASDGALRGAQIGESLREEKHEEGEPADASRDSGIRQKFQIVVVRVVHDETIVVALITGIDILQGAEARAQVGE